MGGVQSAYAYLRNEKEQADVGIQADIAEKTVPVTDVGIQADIAKKQTDESVQADIATFTEKLLNNSDPETYVGSEEALDKTCEVCPEDGEVEGFCEQCRQWLCLRCCKCHEKTTTTKFHRLVGKADVKGSCVRKPLIEKRCTPFAVTKIGNSATCSAYSSNTGYIAYRSYGDLKTSLYIYSNAGIRVKCIDFPKFSYCTIYSIMFDTTQKGDILFCDAPILDTSSRMYTLDYASHKPEPIVGMGRINGKCYDIKEFDNGFAVSILLESGFASPTWQVQLLNLSGEVKRQICYDKDGNPLFKDARAIGTNMAKTVLYVQDKDQLTVTAFNTGGDVVFKVKHGIQSASLLTVDNDDNIYVASGDTVVRVDAGGEGSTVILKGNTKSRISSICFNLRKEQLVIFESNPNTMKSFSFI